MIDLGEMAVIMETMDDIDGIKPGNIQVVDDVFTLCSAGEIRYDSNGNPEPLPTAMERAESLFSALDRDNDGCLTKKEFLSGYNKRSLILRRQDADDQKRKLTCLLLYGPLLNREVGMMDRMVHG